MTELRGTLGVWVALLVVGVPVVDPERGKWRFTERSAHRGYPISNEGL